MQGVHVRGGGLRLSQVVILVLALALFVIGAPRAFPAETSGVLWAKQGSSGWRTDLVADGHATTATAFAYGCESMGPRPQVSFPANGAAFVKDLGAWQCTGSSWGVLEVPAASAPGTLTTRAEFLATGLTLFVPASSYRLTSVADRARAGGLVNDGDMVTHVLAYVEGWGGLATVTVWDGQGELADIQTVELVQGINFVRIDRAFAAGSLTLRLGSGDGHFPAGGPVWAWATSGPMSNSSAAVVVPFRPVVAPTVTP